MQAERKYNGPRTYDKRDVFPAVDWPECSCALVAFGGRLRIMLSNHGLNSSTKAVEEILVRMSEADGRSPGFWDQQSSRSDHRQSGTPPPDAFAEDLLGYLPW